MQKAFFRDFFTLPYCKQLCNAGRGRESGEQWQKPILLSL